MANYNYIGMGREEIIESVREAVEVADVDSVRDTFQSDLAELDVLAERIEAGEEVDEDADDCFGEIAFLVEALEVLDELYPVH